MVGYSFELDDIDWLPIQAILSLTNGLLRCPVAHRARLFSLRCQVSSVTLKIDNCIWTYHFWAQSQKNNINLSIAMHWQKALEVKKTNFNYSPQSVRLFTLFWTWAMNVKKSQNKEIHLIKINWLFDRYDPLIKSQKFVTAGKCPSVSGNNPAPAFWRHSNGIFCTS